MISPPRKVVKVSLSKNTPPPMSSEQDPFRRRVPGEGSRRPYRSDPRPTPDTRHRDTGSLGGRPTDPKQVRDRPLRSRVGVRNKKTEFHRPQTDDDPRLSRRASPCLGRGVEARERCTPPAATDTHHEWTGSPEGPDGTGPSWEALQATPPAKTGTHVLGSARRPLPALSGPAGGEVLV